MTIDVIVSVLPLSFLYGFYRGWTLPFSFYDEESSKKIRLYTTFHRLIIAVFIGISYIIPPICLFKYRDLIYRVYDYYVMNDLMDINWRLHLYHEFGIYHPHVF